VAVVTASTEATRSPESRGRVFVLDPKGNQSFEDDARRCWDFAGVIAEREARASCFVRTLREAPPRAQPIFGLGEPMTLEGRSFGLSFVLARLSALSGHAVPSHLIASATLGDDGGLNPVHGLDAKLNAIARTALGVRCVLLHPDNAEEARAIVKNLPRALEIVEVKTVADAVKYAFGERLEQPPLSWDDDAALDASLRALRARTLAGHALNWAATLRALEWIAARRQENARIPLLAAIARRHTGAAASLALDWDEDAIDEVGNELVAHIVQAAADAGDDRCSEFVARALDRVRNAPAEPGSIKALGACARALAAMRRFDEAQACAERAVQRWIARDERDESSYALCEWLRVAGVRKDQEAIERALIEAADLMDHPNNGAYVRLASMSALVRTGQPERALRLANAVETSQPYVKRSMLRWAARANDALGEREQATRMREVLRNISERSEDGQQECRESLFARLDEALAQGHETAEILIAIEQRGLQGARWILADTEGTARARRLADEYAY
jgi:tetratricopeptide (TPR) repeat protein